MEAIAPLSPSTSAASGGAEGGEGPRATARGCVQIDPNAGSLISPAGYSILPVDLKDLSGLDEAVRAAGLRYDLPTYVLSECVLVYMEPDDSAAVIRQAGRDRGWRMDLNPPL